MFCFSPDRGKAEAGPQPLPGDVGPVEQTWRNAEVLPSDLGQRNLIFFPPITHKETKKTKNKESWKKNFISVIKRLNASDF